MTSVRSAGPIPEADGARLDGPADGEDEPDGGMVTAEFAVVLPAVVFVLATALAGIACVVDEMRCVDAARTAARSAARGDATPTVVAFGARLAPPGSVVDVVPSGGAVTVRVTAPGRPWAAVLSDALRPRAEAVMPLEAALPDGGPGTLGDVTPGEGRQ